MPSELVVRVPADKSITHRALMLAALASGRSRIRNSLTGADTQATAAALRTLGVAVPALSSDIVVDGRGTRGLRASAHGIDCHNSGTTARLLMGLLSGHAFETELTGDDSLRSRPMRRVTVPLERMGVRFTELGEPDRLPVRMRGGALRTLHYDSPHASAQVKSAILLAGLTGGTEVSVTEPRVSRDHTERMMLQLGLPLVRTVGADGRHEVRLGTSGGVPSFEMDVPGDASSAAFMAAFARLGGTRQLRIEGVGLNPTRTGFIDVVRRMGGRIAIDNERESCGEPVGDLLVERSELRATHIGGDEIPTLIDEVPILAILAARASGTTIIEDAAELRVKESDRIRSVVEGLLAVGVQARERPAGLEVEGTDAPLSGRVATHADHRLAMAFGVLGHVPGARVMVDDEGAAAVSYPEFWTELRRLAGAVR